MHAHFFMASSFRWLQKGTPVIGEFIVKACVSPLIQNTAPPAESFIVFFNSPMIGDRETPLMVGVQNCHPRRFMPDNCRMIKPTLLVLAAGMGSRYGGLKQIDPVGPHGETIIDYSIYDALRAGFSNVVFVIRRDIESAFRESIGGKFEDKIAVDYVFQELDSLPAGFKVPPGRVKPWGTSHAILVAGNVVREPFAAINADDFYGAQSFLNLAAHLTSGSTDYSMVGFVLRNTLSDFGSVSRGVCQCTADGYLAGITEFTKIEKEGGGAKYPDSNGVILPLSGNEIVSMNMWGFSPDLFDHLRRQFIDFLKADGAGEKSEFYIPTAVNTLIASGKARVKVLQTPDSWHGVTFKEDRPRVMAGIRSLIERGEYPENLWV